MQEHNQTTRELFNLDNGTRPNLQYLPQIVLYEPQLGKASAVGQTHKDPALI